MKYRVLLERIVTQEATVELDLPPPSPDSGAQDAREAARKWLRDNGSTVLFSVRHPAEYTVLKLEAIK